MILAIAVAAVLASSTDEPAIARRVGAGIEALARGEHSAAIEHFQWADKKSGNNCVPCRFGLAQVYLAKGDLESTALFGAWLSSHASDARMRSEGHVLVGLAAAPLKTDSPPTAQQLIDAETAFRAALGADGSNGVAHYRLAQVRLAKGETNLALESLRQAVALLPPGDTLAEEAQKILLKPALAGKNVAPDFEAKTSTGDLVSGRSLRGRVLLLDFWATWCPPCVASVPDLHDLMAEFFDDGLIVVSISADEDEKTWRAFIEKKAMTWPQIHDGDGRLNRLFSVTAMPTYIVLDRDGAIRATVAGVEDQSTIKRRLRDLLRPVLVESPAR